MWNTVYVCILNVNYIGLTLPMNIVPFSATITHWCLYKVYFFSIMFSISWWKLIFSFYTHLFRKNNNTCNMYKYILQWLNGKKADMTWLGNHFKPEYIVLQWGSDANIGFNIVFTHSQLTILFYKSISRKSDCVGQAALNRNNSAQWILLISLNWEHSRDVVVGTQMDSEWGKILIPCRRRSHGGVWPLGGKPRRWWMRWSAV